MKRIKVAVIMGGPSHEYEVSLRSGEGIIRNIDKNKYEPIKIEIDLNGKWAFGTDEFTELGEAISKFRSQRIDVAFLAVHGNFGEDGTIQSLLELKKIPYTGSSVAASVLAMDKLISEQLFNENGLLTPGSLALDTDSAGQVIKEVKTFPVVVKPMELGSSVGVSIVENGSELEDAIKSALSYDQMALIQPYIKGREVSCGVLENKEGEPEALPPTELIPVGRKFFDYEAKYSDTTKEITPHQMPHELIERIQKTAVIAHKVLGCSSYSRTDIIVSEDDKLYILETNTLPGFTTQSIIPQQATAAGISYPELIDRIINHALKEKDN